MAVAIHQGTDLDKTQMELLAEKARFVSDPAQSSRKADTLRCNLYLDSTVKVQIWSGTVAKGTPVLENGVSQHPTRWQQPGSLGMSKVKDGFGCAGTVCGVAHVHAERGGEDADVSGVRRLRVT